MARINDTPELDPVLFPNISVAGFLQHYVEDRIENALPAEATADKQPPGTGTTEKCTEPATQKRTRTTKHDTQTQPLLLAADAFAAAPAAEPDWCTLWEPILQNTNEQGIWPADRTIMLRRTSKRVKEVVDKMRLPAVVRLSRSFWRDARNGTKEAKLEFVLRQLAAMAVRCLITTLELSKCEMKGQDAERLARVLGQCRELVHLNAKRLAGVLAQCAALAHLNLCNNRIGPGGAEKLAGVLGQCAALAHVDLSRNDLGAEGAGRLAGVLGQCPALAYLNLSCNKIGPAGARSLARVLGQCAALAHLNLGRNQIGPAGAEILAGVMGQCAALVHLNLSYNEMGIGSDRAEKLTGVLAQCTALAHLDLSWNSYGDRRVQTLARVMTQCPALTYLNLRGNCFRSAPAQSRLRKSWCGRSCGHLFYKGKAPKDC